MSYLKIIFSLCMMINLSAFSIESIELLLDHAIFLCDKLDEFPLSVGYLCDNNGKVFDPKTHKNNHKRAAYTAALVATMNEVKKHPSFDNTTDDNKKCTMIIERDYLNLFAK